MGNGINKQYGSQAGLRLVSEAGLIVIFDYPGWLVGAHTVLVVVVIYPLPVRCFSRIVVPTINLRLPDNVPVTLI